MNFSSIPPYLHPSNWQQQVSHQLGTTTTTTTTSAPTSQLPPPPPPPPPPHGGSIRPGSMAERARLANVPMPDATLKCPRCESTNTKFCYFNNYSLTQPRHFCKTCRRYWTRGGALRNVPVGGGCRRNKRSKGRNSKSPPVSSDRQQQTSGSANSSSSAIASNNNSGLSPQIPPHRFMAPLHHHHHHQQLTDFDIGGFNYGGGGVLSAPATATGDLSFQLGNTNLAGGTSIGSLLGFDQQWRLQQQAPQFPFLSSLDPFDGGSSGGGGGDGSGWQMRPKLPSGSRNLTQMGNSVKMEGTPNHEANIGRQFVGNEQYWSGGSMAWSDLSGFSSSSSARNPL